MAERDRTRNRALGALAAVVALALGVGVVLAAGAYAAARMVGLTDTGGNQATARAASAPSRTPRSSAPSAGTSPSRTATAPASPSPTAHHESAAAQAASRGQDTRRHQEHRRAQHPADRHQHRRSHQHARRHHRRHHQRHHRQVTGAVSLHAARTRVRPMARIDLGGRCGCRSGTTLVVQRLEHGHWSRFPATATASRGRFHTWVMTGRRGPNRFRVVIPGGPASNPVTITVT